MMRLRTVDTYTALIFIGLRAAYGGPIANRQGVIAAIQAYVNAVGLGLTVTNTEFIYSGDCEPGLTVGLINYPRFPSTRSQIRAHAFAITEMLMECCGQLRASVVMTDKTTMLEDRP